MEAASWAGIVEGLFGGIAGAIGTVFGLSRWLGKVWAGRILEGEKQEYRKELEQIKAQYAQELTLLRAEIERRVFVTRVQFETEFVAYKQVFEALAQVRLAIEATRPMLSVSPMGETEEDRKRKLAERLRELMDAYNKLVNAIENQRPFYPSQLYSHLMECLKAANLETMDIQTAGNETFTFKWYEEGAKRREEFMAAYTSVSDAIRSRIETLALLPRG
jgi:hypothetical protein